MWLLPQSCSRSRDSAANPGRCWPIVHRTWVGQNGRQIVNFGRDWPSLAKCAPIEGQILPASANVDQFAQTGSKFVTGPKFVQSRQKLAKFGKNAPAQIGLDASRQPAQLWGQSRSSPESPRVTFRGAWRTTFRQRRPPPSQHTRPGGHDRGMFVRGGQGPAARQDISHDSRAVRKNSRSARNRSASKLCPMQRRSPSPLSSALSWASVAQTWHEFDQCWPNWAYVWPIFVWHEFRPSWANIGPFSTMFGRVLPDFARG